MRASCQDAVSNLQQHKSARNLAVRSVRGLSSRQGKGARMRLGSIVIGGIAAASATAAQARSTPSTGTPPAIQSLLACQSVTDAGQRLSCFDRAAQGLAEAMNKKEVVVVDKARANEAK